LVLEGTYKQVIDSISNYFTNVDVRVLHQPYPYEIIYEEELLNSNYNKLNNTVNIIKDGNTLLPFNTAVDLYKSNYSGTFSSFFNSYLRLQKDIQWVDSVTINPINVTVDVKSTECDSDNNNFIYNFDNLVGYANNKNYISGKSTIKCEAALSLGTLSKALAWGFTLNNKEASNDDKMAFIRSLIWSDYCYVIAEVEGIKLYTKDGLSKDLNKGKVELIPDWIKGTGTDVKFYNKAMTRLRQEGYLPNRVRMMLGSYIIKVMGYSHLAYGEYLEHFLIGFNCANNWLGAQSCNGTGVDTIPGGRSFNIRKQLDEWDSNGEYK
jgi:deoxyribodipyrimidine photolyase